MWNNIKKSKENIRILFQSLQNIKKAKKLCSIKYFTLLNLVLQPK